MNPENGDKENKHWAIAMQLLLHAYGVMKDGVMVLPGAIESNAAAGLYKTDSYDSARW